MNRIEQVAYIKQYYLKKPLKTIAREINRSNCFVRGVLKKAGLKVPPELAAERKRKGMYRKGHSPANKGMKQCEYMSAEAIERTKATRFKKGNKPHNTRSNYELSIRDSKGFPYVWIRVALGEWVLYHRWMWEQLHGAIPAGHNVQFLDGDSTNVRPSNLYIIDKRTQCRINHQYGGKTLPPELIQTIKLLTKIKSKINEK